ncbi:response regulator [Desulfurivibrio dismutans]|uniref:response regulator n=1 Tax=Desulfurivibrio dismutans TaxID=1398908 RepID=UPI0023DC2CEF|nr:response regulator [Desulfurivibrio alkaliphilus]MDF1614306.1 response regulator [Desulfurivibrio alkaliphilus]
MRILLVDDEEELVSALAERLQLRGITADWATSGRQALELAHRQTYDVAVIDLKMPGISGVELKKQLVAGFPGLRFIFMSGHGSLSTFESGIGEAGHADYFLLKPVDINQLLGRISELLATSHQGH